MLLHLNAASGLPIYRQVFQQLRERIVSGRLAPDQQLPSVRELSVQLKINPLTVAKVYQLLEREGLVELRRGLGTFVSAVPRTRTMAEKRRLIAPALRQLVTEAQHLRLTRAELRDLIDEHLREAARHESIDH